MRLVNLNQYNGINWKSVIEQEIKVGCPIEFIIPLDKVGKIPKLMKELDVPWLDMIKGKKFLIGPCLRVYDDGYLMRKKSDS